MMPDTTTGTQRSFCVVALCFLFSGFAALLYEIVWMRQFAILFGTSEQALAVVLASYMAGLALGSVIVSRWVTRIRRPLWVYGILELGIAITALLMPLGLDLVRLIQVSLFGGLAEPPDAGGLRETSFYFAAAFALLMPPTAMMGATLPLLSRHLVQEDRHIGPRTGLLYAINTAGAVLGTLTAAFVCLPNLGMSATVWVGALTNGVVFGLILLVARPQTDDGETRVSADAVVKVPAGKAQKPHRWILLLMAVSGAISFGYEILFTRMLGHMIGGSIFAFAIMLSSFLTGISLGGAIGSRMARSRGGAITGFMHTQAVTAGLSLAAFHLLEQLARLRVIRIHGNDVETLPEVLSSMLILSPPAVSIGATFPFAIRILARSGDEAGSAAGQVYAWNTTGGILGALLTGLFVLPAFHYHQSTVLFVSMNIGIAVLTWLFSRSRIWGLSSAVAAGGLLMMFFPPQAINILRISPYPGYLHNGELIYTHAGRSATVSLFSDLGYSRLQTNGLPEAETAPDGAPAEFLSAEVWLGALPTLVRPNTQDMLIIGLGGGVAASHIPASVAAVDVFELEPAVVEANRRVAGQRSKSPLKDPRIRVILNDARGGLTLTTKQYDAIVSQPSHPWTAGASHLYTKDFMETARDHLNGGGVFLQWMSGGFVDEHLMSSLSATLLDTFKYVRLYEPNGSSLLFLASDDDISLQRYLADSEHWITDQNAAFYERLGIIEPNDLFAMLTLDTVGLRDLAEGADIITDENNLMALRTADFANGAIRDKSRAGTLSDLLSSLALLNRMDLPAEFTTVDRAAIVRQHIIMRRPEYAEAVLEVIADQDLRETTEAWVAMFRGDVTLAHKLAQSVLERSPQNSSCIGLLFQMAAVDPQFEISDDLRMSLLNHLSRGQRAVVNGLEAMLAGNMNAVKKSDDLLAGISRRSLEFSTAVSLRVRWRMSDQSLQQQQLANEALDIIDASLPVIGFEQLAVERTFAAAKARDFEMALSTAAALVREIRGTSEKRVPQNAVSVRVVLEQTLGIMEALAAQPGIDRQRLQDLLTEIRRELYRLAAEGRSGF